MITYIFKCHYSYVTNTPSKHHWPYPVTVGNRFNNDSSGKSNNNNWQYCFDITNMFTNIPIERIKISNTVSN